MTKLRSPKTGRLIGEMTELLDEIPRRLLPEFVVVSRKQLQYWHDELVYTAAYHDPDNPPLTRADLKRMKRTEKVRNRNAE